MKIKYADYRNHKNIISKRCAKIEKEYKNKKIIAYLGISDKVKKSWFVPRDNGKECMHADGYSWLQIYGVEDNCVISAIFDEKYNFVETYFDIARRIYIEDVPYAEDLYLDVVQTKNNNFIILDEDELKEALDKNEITDKEYDMAYLVKDKIIKNYSSEENFKELNRFTKECLNECLQLL